MRVLLVEDDPRLVRMLVSGLQEERLAVTVVTAGAEALRTLAEDTFDACILDVNLPDLDGFAVLQQARARRSTVPILMLTARDGVPDRVRGLNLGADDYLIKPFAFSELLARLHALFRRGTPQRDGKLRVGDVELDPGAHRVTRAGQPVALSPKQFSLLEYLLRNAGTVVARTTLLQHVWGYAFDPGTNVIDVHIGQIRSKLDRPGLAPFIQTIRCVGYKVSLGTPD